MIGQVIREEDRRYLGGKWECRVEDGESWLIIDIESEGRLLPILKEIEEHEWELGGSKGIGI